MLTFLFIVSHLSGIATATAGIEGRQIVREIFPDPQHSNIDYGVGYNSISLSRTGTAAVNITTVTPRSRTNSAFLSHSFQIKHFSSREELQTEYGEESELTRSEGLMGSYQSKFRSVLLAEDVRVFDSVLTVDVDIVTDTESVRGPVKLGDPAKKLLDAGKFDQFVDKYGTHYLRKKTYGGKLILLIKVPSKTEEEKKAVDEKLKQAAGYIGQDADFRSKIEEIQRAGQVELQLYTLGGDVFNSSLSNLSGVIDFVLNFSSSVRSRDQVRSLEFGAVWSLVGVPTQFKQFVFQHQRSTDKILGIYTELRELQNKIDDISLMKDQELDWLSDEGHGKIQGIGVCLAKCQNNLARKFRNASVGTVGDVYLEFKQSGSDLEREIEEVLQAERRYENEEEMFLINTEHMTYISQQNWEGYCTASSNSPLTVYLDNQNLGVSDNIRYHHSQVYIRSTQYPGQVLCLGRNYYGAFWKSESYIYPPYCSFTLSHSSDFRKSELEYGDQFVLRSVMWPSFLLGLDDTGGWVLAVMEGGENSGTVWQLKKTPGH